MPPIPGAGLAKGLAVTLRTMTKKTVTAQYPDVQPELPPRSRGVIALFEENCTVCMLCARECPDWCIYIDSHKETVPAAAPGGRERSRNVLDRFAIDFSLCMYCGICIEVCPFDALFWSPEFEYAETDILELTHERDKLRDWMWTVPEPPALDPAAEEPKEIAAARKTAEKLRTQREQEAAAAATPPVPTDPAPTDPTATDPAPTDPTATDPAPTDPTATDPAPTDPTATDQEGQA
ncbi:4Fe-4S binding protein [Streptomyces sp. NPDC048669]|uniref:NuoI/complex I 23 kDa subunit family protein n=1 Tax=Streptomyces sp. NPDC048669 TaxID=3155267 RepID=UPI003439372E